MQIQECKCIGHVDTDDYERNRYFVHVIVWNFIATLPDSDSQTEPCVVIALNSKISCDMGI